MSYGLLFNIYNRNKLNNISTVHKSGYEQLSAAKNCTY